MAELEEAPEENPKIPEGDEDEQTLQKSMGQMPAWGMCAWLSHSTARTQATGVAMCLSQACKLKPLFHFGFI